MDKAFFTEVTQRMEKSIASMQHEFSKLRTGRASLSMLDDVRVDFYGTPTPLMQVATLGTPDPRTITIQPWDSSVIQAIEKAIVNSGLGLAPIADGRLIRISIPALNEERRKELVKVVKKQAEEAKVAIRNIRREANEKIKKLKKDLNLTEDDERKSTEEVQKLTDSFVKKIDDNAASKEKDILTV